MSQEVRATPADTLGFVDMPPGTLDGAGDGLDQRPDGAVSVDASPFSLDADLGWDASVPAPIDAGNLLDTAPGNADAANPEAATAGGSADGNDDLAGAGTSTDSKSDLAGSLDCDDGGGASAAGDAADSGREGPLVDAVGADDADSPVLGNLALSGTAYRWFGNATATANTNQVAEPKLNDGSTAVDVDLAGAGWDMVDNAWEAAGVVLSSGVTVTSVVFVNGKATHQSTFSADGNFAANFHLQLSTDGIAWTDATGWSLSPAYPYDETAASHSYVFSGLATGVRGLRVTGQVRLGASLDVSWNASASELQVWGYR